jgi:NAD(P)-dependent dehydrogenase (short-subunit alcohol dehydrogenase family)
MSTSTTPISLITGGSRGLGKSAALALAAQGNDIVITYRGAADEAAAVVKQVEALGRRAVALQLDVGDTRGFGDFVAQLKRALSQHWQRERFDHLVNNAGVGLYGLHGQFSEAHFDELVNVHFKGVYFLTQALLPLIHDGGRIVNLSSGLTRFSLPGYSAYASMKGAVEVLSHYLALELGPRRITVNVIAPGAIETDFGGGQVRDNKQLNAMIAGQTALGRVGLPDDVGGAVAALLSPGNRWVNGQRIEVSGGIHL